MSIFDDAMEMLSGNDNSKRSNEDIGLYEQKEQTLIIYDKEVIIRTPLKWDDKFDQFSIRRSKELSEENIIPKVTIIYTDRDCQPVIGPKTNDNLSYGRYELARGNFRVMSIVGCNVTLINECVENFTIGVYGIEDVPAVNLLQNATLTCPETSGKRIMQVGPEPLEGSTKHSRRCKYIIWTDESSIEDFLSPEILDGKKELEILNPKMAEFVGLYTNLNRLNSSIELLKMNNELDISKLLTAEYRTCTTSILIGSVVLGLSDKCANAQGDMFYEMYRWPELARMYNIPFDDEKTGMFNIVSETIIKVKYKDKQFDELSLWDKKIIYELIPIYSFNFGGKEWVDCAEEWWDKVVGS